MLIRKQQAIIGLSPRKTNWMNQLRKQLETSVGPFLRLIHWLASTKIKVLKPRHNHSAYLYEMYFVLIRYHLQDKYIAGRSKKNMVNTMAAEFLGPLLLP